MGKHPLFTQQEDNYIRQHYASMPHRDIADRLGRSVCAIRHRAEKIGVPRKVAIRRWTPEEDKIILASKGRDHKEVATLLGRDGSELSKRARKLGFKSWRNPDGLVRADDRKYIHRSVVEKHLGRALTSSERVHHIDCNKRNNDPSNLHLFPNPAAHAKCHWSLSKLCDGDESRCAELLRLGKICFNRDKGVYE